LFCCVGGYHVACSRQCDQIQRYAADEKTDNRPGWVVLAILYGQSISILRGLSMHLKQNSLYHNPLIIYILYNQRYIKIYNILLITLNDRIG